MEENHAYSEIIGAPQAPYINGLATAGALFTSSHGVEHPSQPNYLDLFSGLNQGVTGDACPYTFTTGDLGSELSSAGFTFTGYSEDLPAAGSLVCTSGAYARKHSPWINFTSLPTSTNQPFTAYPTDYSQLPTLSFVIPNLNNDMHDGTIAQGDSWLQTHLQGYAQWTQTHNSLLIVDWDEDDFGSTNQIPTIFYGPMVMPGQYGELINHFNVLRTLEDMYGLPALGLSASATPITDVWLSGSTATATPLGPTATATVNSTATPSAIATRTPGASTATATVGPSVSATATRTPTANLPTATTTRSGSPTATATPCPIQFSDVTDTTAYYYPSVYYLACHGIISGYSDGTFRPFNNTTRAQLTKIVTLAFNLALVTPPATATFADVDSTNVFYQLVETAAARSIVSGYTCGGSNPQTAAAEPCDSRRRPYFRPANNVTRSQLTKIVVIGTGWTLHTPASPTFTDVATDNIFYGFIETAVCHGIISGYNDGTFRPTAAAFRSQIAKISYLAVTNTAAGCTP